MLLNHLVNAQYQHHIYRNPTTCQAAQIFLAHSSPGLLHFLCHQFEVLCSIVKYSVSDGKLSLGMHAVAWRSALLHHP